MTTIFPTNNLPTASQPWAREVQKQLSNLIASYDSERINNTARDNQLNSSIIALGGVVTDTTTALKDIGLLQDTVLVDGEPQYINGANIKIGTLSADKITTGTLNASLVTVSNINASNITSGTITGITLQTGASGRRVIISGTSAKFYNTAGTYAGEISATGTSTITIDAVGGAFISVFNGGAQIYGDGNNSITLTNNEIDFGTSQMVGTVPASWQTSEGAWFGRGAFVVANVGNNAASFSRSNAGEVIFFYRGSTTAVGNISVTASATTYNSGSDYRLKENIVPLTGALDRILQLKPSRFNFKVEPEKIVDGFIAHEVSPIVPEAITGEKDEVDEDGNPKYQSIDQSKLMPLAIAAIQELADRIETLEKGA